MVGFRMLNALPFQTGNTKVYNTFSGTGFRPLDSQLSANYITTGPLSNFDTSIFEDYAPTYIPIPQSYYNPSKGMYEHDGKEIIDDKDPNFDVDIGVGGDYITATDLLGPPPKEDYGHPGVSDTQKGGGGNDNDGHTGGSAMDGSEAQSDGYGGLGHYDGGMIPPVYANQGEAMPTFAEFADLERRERERKERERIEQEAATAGTKSTGSPSTDLANFGTGMYDLALSLFGIDKIKEDPTKAATVGTTSYGLNKILGNSFFDPVSFAIGKGLGAGYDYIFNKPEKFTGYPNQIGIEDISGYGPEADGYTSNKDYNQSAFDFSPFNVDPNTGQVMTAQSDTIPGDYSPPSVNINFNKITADNFTDPSTNFFSDLQAAFDEFNTNFEAEQEAKAQALADAQAAAAAASTSGSFSQSDYDDKGGWGPGVGGYNDPGAFGGHMGSSPGDKSTW